LLVGGIAAVVVFALALIGYGYYTERIAPKGKTVITVGSRKFDYAFIERRAKAELARGRINPSNLGEGLSLMLATVQREELLRQTASTMGLVVTEAELDARYRERLGLSGDASRDELALRLRSQLLFTGLSLAEYRDIVRSEVVEQKLKDQLNASVPAETEHVNLRLIQTSTEADASKAKERLDQGALFAVVAVEMSIDPLAKTNGGEISWTPRGILPKQVDDVAFALAAGVRSDVIESDEGFYVIESRGIETRPLTDEVKPAIVQRSVDNQLKETSDRVGVAITITQEQLQELVLSLRSATV